MSVDTRNHIEPKLILNGMSEDELFDWLSSKERSIRRLKGALAEKESIQQALVKIESEIAILTNLSAINILREERDSNLNQESLRKPDGNNAR